jgi:DNA-binding MarR family transcriptional regulator
MGDLSKDIQTKITDEWVKALLNIKYTANYLNQIDEKFFSQFGLSSQQFNALRILRGAQKPISVSEIKSRMVEKTPNITRLMDKLSAKNLITRHRTESDRRTVYSEITDNGLKLLAEIDQKGFQTPLNHLSEEEVKDISRLLEKIRS